MQASADMKRHIWSFLLKELDSRAIVRSRQNRAIAVDII